MLPKITNTANMSSNDIIANIYKFDREYYEPQAIIETITELNKNNATDSFKEWAHKLIHSKFQIISLETDLTVVFTIYTKQTNNKPEYVIIVDTLFDEIKSTSTYQVNHSLESIDIDNMSDIISIFTKICTKEISNYNKQSMIDLFELRMTTIATKTK